MATFAMKLGHFLSSKSLSFFFFFNDSLEGCSSNILYCHIVRVISFFAHVGGNCSFPSFPHFFIMCYQSPPFEVP